MNHAIIIKGELPKMNYSEITGEFTVGFEHEKGTPFHHRYNPKTHTFITVKEMGKDGVGMVYEGSCSEEALIELEKEGVKIAKLHEVWAGTAVNTTSKKFLQTKGMKQDKDGYAMPSHKIAGDSAKVLGRPPASLEAAEVAVIPK